MKKKYYLFELKVWELNVVSIILLVLALLVAVVLRIPINLNDKAFTLAFVFMIPYLFLHELLHGLSYRINGGDSKNISYGAHLEKGVLCCLCKQNISKKNILISLLTPFIVIGVISYIIGILTNNICLILLSIINISGCSGDIMMFIALSSIKDFEYSEYDNPTAFGIYTDEDLSNKRFFGIKYIGNTKKLDISKTKKKLDINVLNIILLSALIIIGIVGLILY